MELCNEYWEQALAILENQLSPLTYKTWIKRLVPVRMSNNVFVINADNSLTLEVLESKYISDIENALTFVNDGMPIKVKLILNNEELADIEDTALNEDKADEKAAVNSKNNNIRLENGLMPRYTFDNFIVGKNNQMAHAAAVAVSQNPGSSYNPLFLYGGVGLGKTHLMNAIGNEVLKNNPDAKILCVSCETFTNELISAIRDKNNNGTEKFRQKYREIDLLLIDDIQFISDKTGTQEEFFFTFNDLWQNGKQIGITSDRPPSDIQKLTVRLSSRLSSGMTIDISQPDIETKIAILQEKAENQGIKISDDVLKYIADSVKSNIREMEGALTTVSAYSKLTNQAGSEISLELAMVALKDKIGSSKPEVTVEYIQSVVGNYFNYSSEDLCSKKKTKDLALARQIAMYLSRKLLNNETLVGIGKKFGGRDHSTVMHAIELVGKKMEESHDFEVTVTDIEKIITGK